MKYDPYDLNHVGTLIRCPRIEGMGRISQAKQKKDQEDLPPIIPRAIQRVIARYTRKYIGSTRWSYSLFILEGNP